MTIKHVLVHIEPGANGERRLRYAISLAQSFGAKLEGISVMPSPTAAAFGMMGDVQVYAAAAEAAEQSCAAARALFERVTAGGPVAVEWREVTGIPADVVAAEACRADIVILGRDDQSDPDGGFYDLPPADVILGCGRPVLVLPSPSPEAFRARRVLLAWKGTTQAARALHDALPLLLKAEEVIVTEIATRHPPRVHQVAADAIADHLRTHGVSAQVRRVVEAGEPGELLIRVAGESDCDLIVAGAYGHNRLREWVLGGVTYSLLHAGAIPCLLSH